MRLPRRGGPKGRRFLGVGGREESPASGLHKPVLKTPATYLRVLRPSGVEERKVLSEGFRIME